MKSVNIKSDFDAILVEEEKYLLEHPEVKAALDLFNISNQAYIKFIQSQNQPVFYTGSSTNFGGKHGELA